MSNCSLDRYYISHIINLKLIMDCVFIGRKIFGYSRARQMATKKRDNYLSTDIQNTILQIMADRVLRTIVNDIKSSPRFSIIAYGTTDTSGREQFSVCIRVVNPNL